MLFLKILVFLNLNSLITIKPEQLKNKLYSLCKNGGGRGGKVEVVGKKYYNSYIIFESFSEIMHIIIDIWKYIL